MANPRHLELIEEIRSPKERATLREYIIQHHELPYRWAQQLAYHRKCRLKQELRDRVYSVQDCYAL